MKTKFLLIALATSLMAACASPEQRAEGTIDTVEPMTAQDSMGKDTITHTGSMSGDNGAGADTTDMNRQKATRQAGNDK